MQLLVYSLHLQLGTKNNETTTTLIFLFRIYFILPVYKIIPLMINCLKSNCHLKRWPQRVLAADGSLTFCPRRESAAIRRKVQSVSGESFANILSAADKKIMDGKHFIFCQSSAANTRSLSL